MRGIWHTGLAESRRVAEQRLAPRRLGRLGPYPGRDPARGPPSRAVLQVFDLEPQMAWRLGVAARCTLQASTRCNVQSTATPSCSPQGNDQSWQQAGLHVALLKYMLGQGAYQIFFYGYNFEQDFVWRISCSHLSCVQNFTNGQMPTSCRSS